MRQCSLSEALYKSIAQWPQFFNYWNRFIYQIAPVLSCCSSLYHSFKTWKHSATSKPLTAGTRHISHPWEDWLNLWQQIAWKYSSFQFDQEKKNPFHLRAVWQTAPWHVRLAAHFVCDKTNLEGGRSNINNSGFFYKRDLFGCDISGSHSKMWNISGMLSWALNKVAPAKSSNCPLDCKILTKNESNSGKFWLISNKYHVTV